MPHRRRFDSALCRKAASFRLPSYLHASRSRDFRSAVLVELELFLRLAAKGRLGAGERSAIAVALDRKCPLAIDDSRAIQRAIDEAGIAGNPLTILRTQDIVVELIQGGVLSLEAADRIRAEWAANHRFRLKISSFRDLL
jgi:hypothetical protein